MAKEKDEEKWIVFICSQLFSTIFLLLLTIVSCRRSELWTPSFETFQRFWDKNLKFVQQKQ